MTKRPPSARVDPAGQHVHRRRADEARDEEVRRHVVEVERRADLLDPAVVHDDDLVGHGHRLDLVVGDVDRGGLQPLVQVLDLGAHRDAQLGVEVRQRLVEQEHLRVAHDRAAHRHALALAARELARIAVEQVGEPEDLGRRPHPRGDLGLRRVLQHQREGHVVGDRQVRVERVVLEHHRDVALLRRQVVHHPVADHDLARGHVLEARPACAAASTCRSRRGRRARRTRLPAMSIETPCSTSTVPKDLRRSRIVTTAMRRAPPVVVAVHGSGAYRPPQPPKPRRPDC